MGKSRTSVRLLVPGATVFLSSACVMTLAWVASRLVARDLGSSLYAWTSVVAVMLAGVSVGGLAGGRIADRFHPRRALAVLLALSSAACVALVIVNNAVGDWLWLWRLSWSVHVWLHVGLVFLLPSMLLGATGPLVVRMALDQGLSPGRTLGVLLAWAAAGGIAGTLLTGFFLIPSFGSTVTVWALGAALLAMAFLYWISCWALYLWAMIFAALATMGMAPASWARDAGIGAGLREPDDLSILYDGETRYHRLWVRRLSERPERRAFLRDQRLQGEVLVDDATDLQSFHAEVCAALAKSLIGGERPLAALFVGSGGYILPRYLKAVQPDGQMDVIEIDPGVTRAASAAFGLPRDTTIHSVDTDPRRCVNLLARSDEAGKPVEQYDLICLDVAHDYAAPFELLTTQFNDDIAALLAEQGLYLVVLTDNHRSRRLLGAVFQTLEQTFPHVWVIGSGVGSPELPDTYVLVASRHDFDPKPVIAGHNGHLAFSVLDEVDMATIRQRSDNVVLTDDYAPVESLLGPAIRCEARRQLTRRYLQQAARLQQQKRYDRSVAMYQRAAEQDPTVARKAFLAVGVVRLEQGDRSGAVEAFERAVASHVETGLQEAAVAAIHVRLGVLLQQMGKAIEARQHLTEAVRRLRIELERNPRSVCTWESLGDALVLAGQLSEAAEAFEQTVSLDPQNLAYHRKWVKVLEVQKRYDEALRVARRQLDLLKKQGDRDAILEMGAYIDFLEYQRVKQ